MEDILRSDIAVESEKEPFRLITALNNKDVNEASDVPRTGAYSNKGQISALKRLRDPTGGQMRNVRDTWRYKGALGEGAWTVGTDRGGQVSLGRG